MAINPYTLNNLYKQGILDYVPTDLMMGTPIGTVSPMTNPYLDMAKQGELYQSHGNMNDSFHSSYTPAYTPDNYQSVSIGSNYGATSGDYNSVSSYNYNGYGSVGGYNTVQIGSNSNAGGINSFNGYGIGSYNKNSTASAFGQDGIIGVGSKAGGINAFGGFSDAGNNLSEGINKTVTLYNRTPKFILGILAGAIGIIGIKHAFKRGKVHSVENKSFLSKLNPFNWSWFRKK